MQNLLKGYDIQDLWYPKVLENHVADLHANKPESSSIRVVALWDFTFY